MVSPEILARFGAKHVAPASLPLKGRIATEGFHLAREAGWRRINRLLMHKI
jgi:hypothetical protein